MLESTSDPSNPNYFKALAGSVLVVGGLIGSGIVGVRALRWFSVNNAVTAARTNTGRVMALREGASANVAEGEAAARVAETGIKAAGNFGETLVETAGNAAETAFEGLEKVGVGAMAAAAGALAGASAPGGALTVAAAALPRAAENMTKSVTTAATAIAGTFASAAGKAGDQVVQMTGQGVVTGFGRGAKDIFTGFGTGASQFASAQLGTFNSRAAAAAAAKAAAPTAAKPAAPSNAGSGSKSAPSESTGF